MKLRLLFSHVFSASVVVSLLAQQVWAQDEEAGPQEKSYALPYLITGLMIALGLMLVLRPSLRQKEFRPPAE